MCTTKRVGDKRYCGTNGDCECDAVNDDVIILQPVNWGPVNRCLRLVSPPFLLVHDYR